jgi:hypothetical protein
LAGIEPACFLVLFWWVSGEESHVRNIHDPLLPAFVVSAKNVVLFGAESFGKRLKADVLVVVGHALDLS